MTALNYKENSEVLMLKASKELAELARAEMPTMKKWKRLSEIEQVLSEAMCDIQKARDEELNNAS